MGKTTTSFRYDLNHGSSKALSKDQGVGGDPVPGNSHPFPKIVGIILPLISIWNCPAHKTNHATFCSSTCPLQWPTNSVCLVCFSLNLNKSTSYLSFCLSLDSFCNETSRTWASLGPEIRFHGFWLGSNSMQGFGWVQILATWVRAPNGFLLGLSSST